METSIAPAKPKCALMPVFVLITLLVLGAAGYFAYTYIQQKQLPAITTYEACAKAPGSTVQTMYPAVCVTQDGKQFTQPLAPEEQQNLEAPGSGAWCQYKGITYANGAVIPSGDTCNSCSCDNGQVSCTAMACP